MIYQHTAYWVMGVSPNTKKPKRQTRRIYRPGEYMEEVYYDWPQMYVYLPNGNCRFGTRHPVLYDKTYAVQPGRGKKSIGRIEILSIRREDVREISNEDVRAEGYSHARDFLHVWASMYDPALERGTWGEKKLMSRPAHRYDAWVLTIEVVKE